MGDNSVNKRSLAISLCQGAGGSQSLVYNCAADCTCTLQCQHSVQCTSRYDIAVHQYVTLSSSFRRQLLAKFSESIYLINCPVILTSTSDSISISSAGPQHMEIFSYL